MWIQPESKGEIIMLKDILLLELKNKLIALGSITSNDFLSLNSASSHFYYLDNYEKNLITKIDQVHTDEYTSGGGHELIDKATPAKMKALRSSSALTFNLIGNKTLKVKTTQYGIKSGNYNVQFEKKLKTLKGTSPATLDAYLISDDKLDCVFCEMKMFEWLSTHKSSISDSYLKSNMYYDQGAFIVFKDYFLTLQQSNKHIRYDAPQMLKHTLGIFNAILEAKNDPKNELHNIKKVVLLNCVWELSDKTILAKYHVKYKTEYENMLNAEHKEYKLFESSFQLIIDLFKSKLGLDFELHYVTHKEFIDLLDKSQSELKYLSRYLI